MAYQNVGTPRFYVNNIEWLVSNGVIPSVDGGAATDSIFKTLPVTPAQAGDYTVNSPVAFSNTSFIAVLGHNMASSVTSFTVNDTNDSGFETGEGVNHGGSAYDGFSISELVMGTETDFIFRILQSDGAVGGTADIGSLIMGTYYDMPHSPDLSLTLTREYGGIKTIETKGGSTLSNDFGSSPPKWGTREAWQLGDVDFSTGGRRIWDLSFSFLSDSSVFPDNPTEIADAGGWEVDDTTPDFMSEVVKKTNGGQLPFIFQPDKDNNSEFAICKLDMKSFKFEQVANGVYNIKLKIREVW